MVRRILLLFFAFSVTASGQESLKFSFGQNVIPGYIKVTPADIYSLEKGYGFDFGTAPDAVKMAKGKKSPAPGFSTGSKPFFFSVKVPPGNYDVKIITGNPDEASSATIRVESRRLLFSDVATDRGKSATLNTTVNIRTPRIGDTGEEVKRKPRELHKLNWDEKITFEFNGVNPGICELKLTPDEKALTVFLAGNSTVVDQDDDPWASWGQMFPKFLKPGIAVSNQAESGLSLGSFLSSNRLKQLLSMAKPGDYLFIEFGHNDQKEKGPDDGAYGSYTERMKLFVTEFRKKGGIPVIVSPANRRSFDGNGKITNSLGDYPAAAKKAATELNVPFIDLNGMTKTLYESLGEKESQRLFVIYPANTFPNQRTALNDNTHFNSYGAYQLVQCIIKGIRDNKLGLTRYLRKDTPVYDPSHPDPFTDFNLPLTPQSPVIIE